MAISISGVDRLQEALDTLYDKIDALSTEKQDQLDDIKDKLSDMLTRSQNEVLALQATQKEIKLLNEKQDADLEKTKKTADKEFLEGGRVANLETKLVLAYNETKDIVATQGKQVNDALTNLRAIQIDCANQIKTQQNSFQAHVTHMKAVED